MKTLIYECRVDGKTFRTLPRPGRRRLTRVDKGSLGVKSASLFSSIRHLGRFALIVALLLSGGTHWFVLQSVAWTAMLVTRAWETSLVDAAKTTFDGRHPCSFCKKIEKGREGEKPQDGPVLTASIELFYEPSRVALHPPPPASWLIQPPRFAVSRAQPPTLPPPRTA
jgi:hypothetical protein